MKPLSLLLTALLPLSTSQLFAAPLHRPQGQLPILSPADEPKTQRAVPLSDILGTQRSLTTFSSLARQSADITELLGSFSHNTTILAPLNSAIEGLPHKVWEDPRDSAQAYEGEQGQDRAKANLRRFVEAHLLGGSPWEEGQKGETVGGRTLWWEVRDGKRVIMPDEVEVEKVASRVANGELWILKGVLNYA